MIGQLIGNYQITRKLGEGGMGVVFHAVHQQLGRQAAIKVLHTQYSRDPEVAQRFFNEAKAVNVIDHPGLVNIYEFGHLPDGSAYIIMEFLKGESLTSRLQRSGGRISPQDTLRLGKQVAAALAAAHSKSIVHRDLKPDNVMIVPDPDAPEGERAKVLDFGIAKVADGVQGGASDVKTRTGMMMGTPVYMSPEQCRGAGGVDDRSDVYALGVMLYHMLAGQPPFLAQGLGDLMIKHIMEPPRPLPEVVPGLNPGLANLVHVMLAKMPQQRPSMAQVIGELNQLGQSFAGWPSAGYAAAPQGSSTPSFSAGPSQIPVANPSTLGGAAGQAMGQPPSMNQQNPAWPTGGAGQKTGTSLPMGKGALAGAALAAVLVIGGGGYMLAGRKPPTTGTGTGTGTGWTGQTGQTGQNGQNGQTAQTYPNGITMVPERPDVSNLDVGGYFETAQALARKQMPDAVLNTMVAMCVKPDGNADLGLCSGVLLYKFRSPARSERGSTPIGVRMTCLVQVVVQSQMGVMVQSDGSERCDEPVMERGPRCSPAEIWRKAIKAGAPKNAIANQLVLLSGQWYITIDGKTHLFPDKC